MFNGGPPYPLPLDIFTILALPLNVDAFSKFDMSSFTVEKCDNTFADMVILKPSFLNSSGCSIIPALQQSTSMAGATSFTFWTAFFTLWKSNKSQSIDSGWWEFLYFDVSCAIVAVDCSALEDLYNINYYYVVKETWNMNVLSRLSVIQRNDDLNWDFFPNNVIKSP